jgi:hypothetical protein
MGIRYAYQLTLLRGQATEICFDWLQTLSIYSVL